MTSNQRQRDFIIQIFRASLIATSNPFMDTTIFRPMPVAVQQIADWSTPPLPVVKLLDAMQGKGLIDRRKIRNKHGWRRERVSISKRLHRAIKQANMHGIANLCSSDHAQNKDLLNQLLKGIISEL